jgi:hypothetical protein
MYYVMVVGLMVVLPILSIAGEAISAPGADLLWLCGKWFVFWSVGARLASAGAKQILQPEFTAATIFEFKNPDAGKIVQELGFANFAIGIVALASLLWSGWVIPAALLGALFYGLAGIKHLFNKDRNAIENTATASDLFIFAVLGVFLIGWVLRHGAGA